MLDEPILVAPLFPLVKVVGFEVFSLLTETPDDFSISDTIEHPVIDLVADGFRKASDVTVATIGAGSCRLRGMDFSFRRRRRRFGARDLVIGGHRSERITQF